MDAGKDEEGGRAPTSGAVRARRPQEIVPCKAMEGV